MTVSCGHVGSSAFTSYTSAKASLSGGSVFDIDMMHMSVGHFGQEQSNAHASYLQPHETGRGIPEPDG
jgi:hypothetical protein